MTLDVENLSHAYSTPASGTRTVIHPLETWKMTTGSQVLLRGISGSGKTTLFNILSGLLQPTTGEVFLNGQSLYAMGEAERDRFRRRNIGYIYQMHYLLPHLNALENIAMPLAFDGWSAGERHEQAMALLQQMGLADHARYLPAQLSSGQRLRVAVARALVNRPTLLLADEPTAALDQDATDQVMDLLQDSCRVHGAILLVASHDPTLNCRFEQIADLKQGTLSVASQGIASKDVINQ